MTANELRRAHELLGQPERVTLTRRGGYDYYGDFDIVNDNLVIIHVPWANGAGTTPNVVLISEIVAMRSNA